MYDRIKTLAQDMPTILFTVKPRQKKEKMVGNSKKLERLNELYIEGVINKEQFNEKRAALLSAPAPSPSPDYHAIQKITLSNANIRESYYALPKPERRAFWRAVIEKIEAKGEAVNVTWRQE